MFSFTSIYPDIVAVNGLVIHTEDSRYVGIKLNRCQLLKRTEGLSVIRSGEENVNFYRHTYACELWTASKLERPKGL